MTAALEGGEWSAARPGRTLPPGKSRYPFYRRLGGPQGLVWTGGKSRPHRDLIPDRPARSSVAIPTELPGVPSLLTILKFSKYTEYRKIPNTNSGVPRNFVRVVQQIQLRTEDRENGDLGAVTPYPLVKGSGGSCNLVQEISFHIVNVS